MKGYVVIPKFYEELWTLVPGVFTPLLYGIKNYFGFELKYADEINVPSDTNVVIVWGVPYHSRPKIIPGILELDKNIKLIMFTGDLQCYKNKQCLDNKIKVFERCDKILSFANEYFIKMYPKFLSKYEFVPHFFSPYERYTQLSFNNTPKMKCLLSGATRNDVYPLRRLIVERHYANVDYKPRKYVVGDNYAKLLHSYFCCAASSSIFNYVLAKYFEIMATGSLLLANETEDSKKLGLVPYEHYIPINKSNVFAKIDQCIENPNDYNDIRKAGMKFVRKNHSVINRLELFKKIIGNLFN